MSLTADGNTEDDDWTQANAGRSKEIAGNVRMNPQADRQGSSR
jgi:hypothetical protein